MRNILGLIALGLSFIASPLAAQTAGSAQGLEIDQTITGPAGVATITADVDTVRSAATFPGGPPTDSDRVLNFVEILTLVR